MYSTLHPDLIRDTQYTIRTYEVNSRKEATVPALIRLMHEAAMENVLKLKMSVWDLEPIHIAWVLMRKHIRIYRIPMLGETIKIRTHPSGFEKVFTYRDYRVWDADGNKLAEVSTTWLCMDTQTRRMTRIPEHIRSLELPPKEECLPSPERKPLPFGTANHQYPYRVNWFDLDFNSHLNNVHYVQWMLESVDKNLLENANVQEVELQYKAESLLHDEILSEVEVGEG
ncbi:MAG: acyl-ACP thioesterase domain-containing protein, partial [Bacteroidota bacterium]